MKRRMDCKGGYELISMCKYNDSSEILLRILLYVCPGIFTIFIVCRASKKTRKKNIVNEMVADNI